MTKTKPTAVTTPSDEPAYFRSRGLGFDFAPGCFVCGGKDKMYHNIAAFVHGEEAGEHVVSLFVQGAWLDYRKSEPSWVQVKIGACDTHRPNLERLHNLVEDGIITRTRINQATQAA